MQDAPLVCAAAKSLSRIKYGRSILNKSRLLRALGVLGFLFSLGAAQPALADGSVSSLGMGMGARDAAAFSRFLAVIAQYNASGEPFRIDSHCQSACTMFLSIRNVCVTPDSTLLFHAGGNMQKGVVNPARSQEMASHYKPALRQYVMANHYMDTFEFHSIPGSEIISRFGYRACN